MYEAGHFAQLSVPHEADGVLAGARATVPHFN